MNKLGNDVRVFLPKYSQINTKYLVNAKYVTSVDIYGEVFNIISAEIDGVPYKTEEETILIMNKDTIHSGIVYNFSKHKNYVFIFKIQHRSHPVRCLFPLWHEDKVKLANLLG